MPQRSLWTGAISFGLVNIPIRLYTASRENTLSFDLLHKKDLSPIRYAKICKLTGDEVPYEEIVKGYEWQPGEYVVVTDEDFKAASVEKTNRIDITEFTEQQNIDPVFYDKSYYIEPQKNAERAYSLLRQALEKSKKVGIAKFVLRNREHLVAIRSYKNLLVLNQLRFVDEIAEATELKIPKEEKAPTEELKLAMLLVDQLTANFKPEKYRDTYTDDLQKLIEKKAKGLPIRKAKEAPVQRAGKVVDLFETLQASLKEKPIKAASKERPKPTTRRRKSA